MGSNIVLSEIVKIYANVDQISKQRHIHNFFFCKLDKIIIIIIIIIRKHCKLEYTCYSVIFIVTYFVQIKNKLIIILFYGC